MELIEHPPAPKLNKYNMTRRLPFFVISNFKKSLNISSQQVRLERKSFVGSILMELHYTMHV